MAAGPTTSFSIYISGACK
ncbi:hypothetical protein YPPY46_0176, partial [Yersinia pestis PY-46]